MEKLEYKKAYKELYLPPQSPVILEIPSINFVVIDGEGNPNGEGFAKATEALYSLSYAVKMSYKGKEIPEGFYDYTVFPLEGVWDLKDKAKPSTDKDNYVYSIMIRQPDFLTVELFNVFLDLVKKKKPNHYLDQMRFEGIHEGLCCQMLHLGSYDDEPASFAKMEQFCAKEGYERISKKHREIYLSDPRKVEVSKMMTVLRFLVKKQ